MELGNNNKTCEIINEDDKIITPMPSSNIHRATNIIINELYNGVWALVASPKGFLVTSSAN